MNEKTNSSGQGRHSFDFEGGEDLTTMGATWFVSYCYYDKIDRTHKNWERVETHNSRQSVYRRTAHYHRFWLERVLEMDSERLSANTIGLTGDEVIKMAKILLNSENKAIKPRRITADEYKKAFEPSNDEQNMQVKNDGTAPYSKLEKALEFAIRTREFEIGLFWKRSNMFMLLTGAAFVGLYTVTNPSGILNVLLTGLGKQEASLNNTIASLIQSSHFYALIITLAGLVFAIAWHLICRGSLFWQKNWEAHISALERPLMGPIYDYAHYPSETNTQKCCPLKAYPFSVSKIMNLTTFFVIVFWVIALIKILLDIAGVNLITSLFQPLQNLADHIPLAGGIVTALIAVGVPLLFVWLFMCKCQSSFAGYNDTAKNDTQQDSNDECPFIELETWVVFDKETKNSSEQTP